MFVKPFRVKTNTRIRGSERKDLRSKIETTFQSYEFEESISSIISNKDEINVLKAFTQKKEIVVVYIINKNPMFFEVDKLLYPTVYFMWRHPKLVPSLTTQSPVITKLANGADLMLPGVIIPSLDDIPVFTEGSAVAINTEDNAACFAVGAALKSSNQIFYSKERQGKAVHVLHVFGDYLWEAGERSQPPKLELFNFNKFEEQPEVFELAEPISVINQTACDLETTCTVNESTDISNESSTAVPCSELLLKNSQQLESMQNSETVPLGLNETDFEDSHLSQREESDKNMTAESSKQEKMNQLLHNCVMTALKVKLKDKELPIPTGTFYSTYRIELCNSLLHMQLFVESIVTFISLYNHFEMIIFDLFYATVIRSRSKVLPCCPSDEFLDIKKTKYKKLSKYLKTVEETGLIEIKEITKGIDHIVTVDRSHDSIRSFQPLTTEVVDSADANTESQFGIVTQKQYEPPEISHLYAVNTATSSLFGSVGIAKGKVMDASLVRQHVTAYVRDNELARDQTVTLDPVLHQTLFGKENVDVEKVKWDVLFSKIFSAMQPYHQLQFKGAEPIVKKGNPVKIIVKLEQRMGNKKVTLVHNLEPFFIRPQDFADQIKKKAQASTSITALPGSKPNFPIRQVLIQGNQVRNVEIVLTGDCYKLSRKYIDGLQAAPKPKGSKRK